MNKNDDNSWKRYSRLSPGDATVMREKGKDGKEYGHIMIVKDFYPNSNGDGLIFELYEQSGNACRIIKKTTNSLINEKYYPIYNSSDEYKRFEIMDYSWNWQ